MVAHASLAQMMGGDNNILFGDRIGCECCRCANEPLEIKGSSVPHPCGKERGDGLRRISTIYQFTTPEDGFGTITSLTRIDECGVDLVQGIQMSCEHHRERCLSVWHEMSLNFMIRISAMGHICHGAHPIRGLRALKRVATPTKNGIRRCT